MKKLFKRHYNACVKRGVITPNTSLIDFSNKIIEEFSEFIYELDMLPVNIEDMKQEAIDVIMVIINMLQHFDIDVKTELLKNVIVQEKRGNHAKIRK